MALRPKHYARRGWDDFGAGEPLRFLFSARILPGISATQKDARFLCWMSYWIRLPLQKLTDVASVTARGERVQQRTAKFLEGNACAATL